MLRFLGERERGRVTPAMLRLAECTRETFAIELSLHTRVRRLHRQGVWALDCDPVEGRYLLSTGGDGHVYLYDLGARDGGTIGSLRGTASRPRHTAGGTGVRWFPWDTGLFTTSSLDETIKAWDTNAFRPVVSFAIGARVFTHAFSPVATSHNLLAAGCRDPAVRLCDVRTGASTHSLMGHTGGVYAVAWAPLSEHVLATGSADRTIRLWDIRGAGKRQCLQTFDQLNVSRTTRSFAERTATTSTAHDGTVNGLQFTPDGLQLLSTSTDGHVRLWSVFDGTNLLVWSLCICATSLAHTRARTAAGQLRRLHQQQPAHGVLCPRAALGPVPAVPPAQRQQHCRVPCARGRRTGAAARAL
eukprot:Unigene12174_Nuclearia_a/m.37013 Unigene12174_Nuclearia_a/g.37013  ORF Unigene12174_Nuclearia_a/g.37013 Unigene12174_Nuclearia_a/m.37013 type:complete len:358 (-) Unigene12174_Nuclearia_a:135-1208(-)